MDNQKITSKADLQKKYQNLIDYIRSLKSVLVAFSGGVDSTFLLAAVQEADINYLAVTTTSASTPQDDIDMVKRIVEERSANHQFTSSGEFDNENFLKNDENRCYHCKSDLYGRLTEMAKELNFNAVVDGNNADDTGDYRPGLQAKAKFKVSSPLIAASLNKEEIRQLSKERGLPTWDRPASPCLSSRIPYGERIESEALRMVEQGERYIKALGIVQVRVRKQADTARIEISPENIATLLKEREALVEAFKSWGFLYVSLDLEGFQSGKLNRVISEEKTVFPIASA
ncbi:ATP-dependent sacrificial sulfur transferase LarE [Magnetococcales bacterium HHB-1]